LTPASRVCVETTIDPIVRARIEASGESINEAGASNPIISGVSERFARLGLFTWVGSPERRRVTPYVDEIADHSCLEARGNVLIRQHIGADAGERGYRIAIEASQGTRRYSIAIERSSLIAISGEAREMIAPDADFMPGTRTPFRDVSRDIYRLSILLIDHIFLGSRLCACPVLRIASGPRSVARANLSGEAARGRYA
jgi:hypothetical protein